MMCIRQHSHKIKKAALLLILWPAAMFYTGYSFAAPLTPLDREVIEFQQRQLLEQNQLQREELESHTGIYQQAMGSEHRDGNGECVSIRQITVAGAEHMSNSSKRRITESYEGKCLTLEAIRALTDAITNNYLQRGFITSRAFLTEQDLSGGMLSIVVVEGTLESITLEGETPLILKTAFPGMIGRILNLRDIEQGMEQINRLRKTPVQVNILPGTAPGTSRINLTASQEFPLQAEVSYDNSGQKSTGEKQIGISLTGNNLMRLGDKSFASVSRSADFRSSQDSSAIRAGFSLPYGYGLLDYSYLYSRYDSVIDQRGYTWYSRGDTQTHRLTGSLTLYRNSDMKTGLMLSGGQRITNNYLNDIRLNSSSRTLSSVNLGITHSQKLGSGYATLNPVVSRGVPWFGGESDTGKQSVREPKAEFTKWMLSGSYYLPLTGNLTWLASVYGQWSPDRLYASERLALGGESSVRGFKEQYLSGDNGGYWRNELNFAAFRMPVAGETGFIFAADGGYLAGKDNEPHSGGSLWGASAGFYTRNTHMTSQLTAGWPLVYPEHLKPDPVSVYYRISFNF